MRSGNKAYWEAAADEHALFAVATSRKDWTVDQFLHDGKIKSHRWVLPWLFEEQMSPHDTTLLEIGCGVGRFAVNLAPELRRYIGIDISQAMLDRAARMTEALPNVALVLGDGVSLDGIESQSVDAVFSYAVLQHVYERDVVLNYLREVVRVLRPGGVAKLQLLGANATTGLRWRFVRIDQLSDISALKTFMARAARRTGLLSPDGIARASATKRRAIEMLRRRLPPDFLVPVVRRYRAGLGMRGEGVDFREATRIFEELGCEVRVVPLDGEPMSQSYWVVVRKAG
jgi:SAM-dependent methyltransferase